MNASPGARRYYDKQRARQAAYNPALRQVGNRLVGILHGCLKTRTLYDEATAWSPRPPRLTPNDMGCPTSTTRKTTRHDPAARRPRPARIFGLAGPFLRGNLAGPAGGAARSPGTPAPGGHSTGRERPMDLRLTGKKALVTGSSSGLGEAIAKRLAAEGAFVVVHGRNQARTEAVAKAIAEAGGAAALAIGDLGTDAGADAVHAAATAGGPVDILVNNVGVYEPSRTWKDTTPEDWAGLYNTNVLTSVRTIQRLVPAMRERGWGRVIQISSVTGEKPQASQPHYAATNGARNSSPRP
ncbi:SDR family NAD(P)-dependent oxidoreductase [Streptomyces chiangmaiensis]